jgi:dihydrofolate reductase
MPAARPDITLIAAVARNGAIGRDGALLWQLPEDMRFFRQTTRGHTVIMGRRTWDALPPRFRPLPARRNIVITRHAQWHDVGAEAALSLDAALELASGDIRVFVIGGADIYAQAIVLADQLLLTEIDRDFEGDVHFPTWDRSHFRECSRQPHHAAPPNDFDFAFVHYQRISGKSPPGRR